MAGFSRSTYVPLPAEEVFEFLLDPAHAMQVMSGVEDFTKLDPGPVRRGTRFSQTRVVNGIRATAEVSVVRFEPPRRLSMRGGARGVEVEISYALRPAPGGTRIELECEVWGRGVMRMLSPLILQFVEREEGEHLERLARALGPRALPTLSAARSPSAGSPRYTSGPHTEARG